MTLTTVYFAVYRKPQPAINTDELATKFLEKYTNNVFCRDQLVCASDHRGWSVSVVDTMYILCVWLVIDYVNHMIYVNASLVSER